MLRRKTVFIVGAGASKEFGLPLGGELGEQIGRSLNIRFGRGGSQFVSGDLSIFEAFRHHCSRLPYISVNPWLEACWRICEALPHHNSIDNLIDNHAGDEKVALCGKLAIAKALLEAEKASKLWFSHVSTKAEIGFRDVDSTWLAVLFRMLQQGVHRTKASQIFDNVSIITFNYDRCIEHYFYYALQHAYGISEAEAGNIVGSATIRHVYGTIGALPWQQPKAVPFGGVGDANLLSCAKTVRTYSERQSDDQEKDESYRLIADADVIVFLGFGYLQTNTALLKPPQKINAGLILGSAKGLSDFNARHVADQFIPWF